MLPSRTETMWLEYDGTGAGASLIEMAFSGGRRRQGFGTGRGRWGRAEGLDFHDNVDYSGRNSMDPSFEWASAVYRLKTGRKLSADFERARRQIAELPPVQEDIEWLAAEEVSAE
jgi:hypothetical protein